MTAGPRNGRRRPAPKEPLWASLSDEELLDVRFKDLDLEICGTRIDFLSAEVFNDLNARGIPFRPHLWFSDEWFTPDGVPGIAIPFYLAHPRLSRLEWRQVMEVEGGSHKSCLRILRHELGHALDNAYQLRRRKKRRDLFGDSKRKYPDSYLPRPFSRRYVLHLDSWYAQSHPDEDFAETFAVWLSSEKWRTRYAGWPALKKLEYMDELMTSIAGRPALNRTRRRIEPVSKLTHTLREHYERKLSRYQYSAPGVYDQDLRRLFPKTAERKRGRTAAGFLRRNRHTLRKTVAKWTSTHPYTVDQILNDMAHRCRELQLRIPDAEEPVLMDCLALLSVHATQYHQRGRQRIVL